MTENPYQSPLATTPPPDLADEPRPRRPLGITILAVLHMLGGLLLMVILLLFALENNNPNAPLTMQNSLGVFSLLACLMLGSSIGFWIGARWGWWMGTFYYMKSLLRNSFSVLMVVTYSSLIPGEETNSFLFTQRLGQIAIGFLIFLYLLQANVLAYFRQQDVRKSLAVLTLLLLGVAWVGLHYVSGVLIP